MSYDPASYQMDVVLKIEALVKNLILDMVRGVVGGRLVMVSRRKDNATEDDLTGIVMLGDKTSERKLNAHSAIPFSRVMVVLSTVHCLVRDDSVISQRELYYLLVSIFKSQRELNTTIQDACATLGCPRFALNIDAASRGVIAGCVKIAPPTSAALVDCELVGTVSSRDTDKDAWQNAYTRNRTALCQTI